MSSTSVLYLVILLSNSGDNVPPSIARFSKLAFASSISSVLVTFIIYSDLFFLFSDTTSIFILFNPFFKFVLPVIFTVALGFSGNAVTSKFEILSSAIK